MQPHDALRQGLVTLKDGAAAAHPVETIQTMAGPAAEAARYDMLRNLYGTALPARMQIERQILDRQVAARAADMSVGAQFYMHAAKVPACLQCCIWLQPRLP